MIAITLLTFALLGSATVAAADRWVAATGDSAAGSSAAFVVSAEDGSMFDAGEPLGVDVLITQGDKHLEVCFLVGWAIENDLEKFEATPHVDPFVYIFGGLVYATTNGADVTDLPSAWGPDEASTRPRILLGIDDSSWEPYETEVSEFKMNFPIRTFIPPSQEVLALDPNANAQVWASACVRMLAEPSSRTGLMRDAYLFEWGHLDGHTLGAKSTTEVEFLFGEVASEPIVSTQPETKLISAYVRSVSFPFDSSPSVVVEYTKTAGQALVEASAWVGVSSLGVLLSGVISWAYLGKRRERSLIEA